MPDSFRIEGGNELHGSISVQGSKNAATKLIAATLLTDETCTLTNVPDIKDVQVMLSMLDIMGAEVSYGRTRNTVHINNKNVNIKNLPWDQFKELRSSVVFIGPLLARFGEITLPYPGGDKIGKRSLDTHFYAFSDLGCKVKSTKNSYTISSPNNLDKFNNKIILDEFSVTATENILMYASSFPISLEVLIAAEEPHIYNLTSFLRKMGARISHRPGHILYLEGSSSLKGAKQKVVHDYIEAGTFVIAALVVGGDILIKNFPIQHLELFLQKLKRAGAKISIEGKDSVRVKTSPKFSYSKIQTMIYPGIPTDLQSPLGVLATQCKGPTLIHDPLYEGRLGYLEELKKWGLK